MTYYPQIISPTDPPDNVKGKAVFDKSNLISSGKLENGNCSPGSSISNISSDTVLVEANVEGVVKESTEVTGPSTKCTIGDLIGNPPTTGHSKPLFLSKNWREILCRCEKCSDFYAQRGISFLLDKEDSIAEYERMAKQKRNENMQKQEGAELNFLNNLGHVEKMEILSGIADMKNELFSFLVCPLCLKHSKALISGLCTEAFIFHIHYRNRPTAQSRSQLQMFSRFLRILPRRESVLSKL